MIIYILFTCDIWKDRKSRCLRGVFTNLELLEEAKQTLKDNEVVDIDENDENAYFDIISIEENDFESDGGFYNK